eukprot:408026-Amphidinium_carterae.6
MTTVFAASANYFRLALAHQGQWHDSPSFCSWRQDKGYAEQLKEIRSTAATVKRIPMAGCKSHLIDPVIARVCNLSMLLGRMSPEHLDLVQRCYDSYAVPFGIGIASTLATWLRKIPGHLLDADWHSPGMTLSPFGCTDVNTPTLELVWTWTSLHPRDDAAPGESMASRPARCATGASASHGNLAATLAGGNTHISRDGDGPVIHFERQFDGISSARAHAGPPASVSDAIRPVVEVPNGDPRLFEAAVSDVYGDGVTHTVHARRLRAKTCVSVIAFRPPSLGSAADFPDLPAGITRGEYKGSPCFWCVCGQHRAIKWEQQFMREHIVTSDVSLSLQLSKSYGSDTEYQRVTQRQLVGTTCCRAMIVCDRCSASTRLQGSFCQAASGARFLVCHTG